MLYSNYIERIEKTGIIKNEVGRPSNDTLKNRKILKMIIFTLVIIIVGLLCYILNDKFDILNEITKKSTKTKNNQTKNNVTLEEPIENKTIDLSTDDEEVVKLFNKMNSINTTLYAFVSGVNGIDYYDYFYKNDKLNASDINGHVQYALAFYELYSNTDVNLDNKIIPLEKINNVLLPMLGHEFNGDFEGVSVGGYNTTYDYNKKVFFLESAGIGDSSYAKVLTKIVKAIKYKDKIEIINKVMFEYGGNGETDVTLYKNTTYPDATKYGAEGIGLINEIGKTSNVNIDDYLDKLDTFKWTFTKNSDGNYIFTSV